MSDGKTFYTAQIIPREYNDAGAVNYIRKRMVEGLGKEVCDLISNGDEYIVKMLPEEAITSINKNAVEIRQGIEVKRLVRCRECIHRDPEDHRCDCAGHEWFKGRVLPMPDDWFCADGEREEKQQ